MLPALGEHTSVDQYKLQALGRHRWAREQAGSRAGLQRIRSCLGRWERAGGRRRPPDPARSPGSQAAGTVGTGGEAGREALGGCYAESFKGRQRGMQRPSWGQWMPLKHMLLLRTPPPVSSDRLSPCPYPSSCSGSLKARMGLDRLMSSGDKGSWCSADERTLHHLMTPLPHPDAG